MSIAAFAPIVDRLGPPVLLITMPFGPLLQPSIGLSLLQAALAQQGVASKIWYLTLPFAERLGLDLYQRIAHGDIPITMLAGEWIFAAATFGESVRGRGYVDEVLRQPAVYQGGRGLPEAWIGAVEGARALAATFLDDWAVQVVAAQPRIVGFTSVFQQHVASLGLARRIKALAPTIQIVFGGANCEGVMGAETARQWPWVDAVVAGEGEQIFPQLVERMLIGQAFDDLPGVYSQANMALAGINGQYRNAPMVRTMDALPVPNYDDFFAQLAACSLADQPARILFESSRGCWWGEKQHCTFCGLNGSTMTFRSKSAERALRELQHLTSQYPGYPVSAVDNILDQKYFKSFVPALAVQQLDLELFYEVKANLRKEQVALLRAAGVRWIQPGIESLSSRVLELMRKGVTSLQNIQLLKWCKELGIKPLWNMLWGFPGEPAEEYQRMANLIPQLTHLAPPQATGTIRLDRFSPNFNQAAQFGFAAVRPYPAYGAIYPVAAPALANLAYYFSYEYATPQAVASYTRAVGQQVRAWRSNHAESDLFVIDKHTHLVICDARPGMDQRFHILHGVGRLIYLACDRIQTRQQLQQLINEHAPDHDLQMVIEPLLATSLLLQEGASYLGLAVLVGSYQPRRTTIAWLQQHMQQQLSSEQVV